ncbi:hypothetical protein EV702DRAFT_968727 [Suillus placidus]|uniref:Uncharacterized protein n=1 Tax=Suillus placidus TaxID=48579 RepID=A0A9P6ZW54_9AGAM|nr:hypothetical protein EV702DRAFT_968727 [Suillus placidus]
MSVLQDANTSTWAARNPTHSTICCRTPPPKISEAQKASRKIKRDQKIELTKLVHNAVAAHLDEEKTRIQSLAHAHNVTPKYINDMISSQTKYHGSRKAQLANALLHAKAKEMNSDQPVGLRYKIVELREMIMNDPEMNNLTKNEKAGYIAALHEHREEKVTHVQGNNMAAARDVLLTTEKIVKELNDLHIRTGTYATLFVVRGHINDTIQSTMHGTDNSDDFWEDVYDLPMADFLRQYEQWACTQNQNLIERDSLEAVRKQVRKLIVRGLVSVTGKKDITMNYNNYNTAIIETYAVQLVGWPPGINFISPSNIGTVGEIWRIRDALKACTCYWTTLTPAEVKTHTANLNERRSAGEIVKKPRKKRSDAGTSPKCKAPSTVGHANKQTKCSSKKAKKNSDQDHEVPKSVEFIVSSDEEEIEDL